MKGVRKVSVLFCPDWYVWWDRFVCVCLISDYIRHESVWGYNCVLWQVSGLKQLYSSRSNKSKPSWLIYYHAGVFTFTQRSHPASHPAPCVGDSPRSQADRSGIRLSGKESWSSWAGCGEDWGSFIFKVNCYRSDKNSGQTQSFLHLWHRGIGGQTFSSVPSLLPWLGLDVWYVNMIAGFLSPR